MNRSMTVRDSVSFGDLVRGHRRALGLTQEALAERAGVSPRGVRALEAGERRAPQRETVRLLAEALELDGDERQRFEVAAAGEVAEVVSALRPPPNNLPDEPTRFIGRESEIEHVAGLLRDPHIRLVTLTGPGGTGKTRLSVEVGLALLPHFRDGVFVVNIAPITDAALVPSAVARALDLRESAGKELGETLLLALSEKQVLLIFDNFEHVLPAASLVAALLDECRDVHILVTSRTPLHVRREHRHAVPPLAVPDLNHLPGPGTLAQCEAVTLFIERARAASGSFGLTTENAADVAAICVQLDGLPLAIELAAARTRLFPPRALRQRLESRLNLLTGGPSDLPDRQRTLRGAIDWSYDLLDPAEKALFARLSVFAGGCTMEAAEQVCDPEGEFSFDLVEGLASLEDKSLIQQEGEAEPRLTMLETIREYAAEALADREEVERLQAAHAAFHLRLSEDAELQLAGPAQAEWLARLDVELGNLRLALQHYLDTGATEKMLHLAATLHRFWDIRGHWTEGQRWLEMGLAHEAAVDAATRAAALTTLGMLGFRQGALDRAAAGLGESVTLWRSAGDRSGTARALRMLGTVVGERGDYSRAVPLIEESLSISRETGDRTNAVNALGSLGRLTAQMGDLIASKEWFEQTARLARELGDMRPLAITLLNLGDLESRLGRLDLAEDRLEEARALALGLGDKHNLAYVLENLAQVQIKQGRAEQARSNLRESMRVARELGALTLLLLLLGEATALAVADGDPVRAARLIGAEEALRERQGIPIPGEERATWEVTRREAAAMLPEEEFLRAREQGAALSLDEAIDFALDETA